MKLENNTNNIFLKKTKGLASQLKMAPEMRKSDIKDYKNTENIIQSAVLILLYKKKGELYLLLTKRSGKLLKHKGQISFPGGKKDISDINLRQTAIREAEEEIGLSENINIIGELTPLLIPVTNFCVHQFVAYIQQLPQLKINTNEVDYILEIAISDLQNSDNIKYKNFGTSTSGRYVKAPYFNIDGNEIWGATAMMISELLDALKDGKS